MRILHTSDWHVGRTFHGYRTLPALEQVLGALARLVAAHRVDVVVIAGDVFDTASPSPDALRLLGTALRQIQQAGAQLVLTSGNHDSPARLGYLAAFTSAAGLHIHADPALIQQPTLLPDEHGSVAFFGVPYLEPGLIRHLPGAEQVATQEAAIGWAVDQIHRERQRLGSAARRAVLISHTFVSSGALAESEETKEAKAAPRDFTRGGVDAVPLSVVADFDYVALGHLHGRSRLAEHVRYCGAPLHYSFAEAAKPRGAWLVELGPEGLQGAEWLDLPVPRPLIELRGTVAELLTDPEYATYQDHWVRGVLTDSERVIEPVRRLKQRFPYFADVAFEPQTVTTDRRSYRDRVRSSGGQLRTDEEIADVFAKTVRNGNGLDAAERELLAAVVRACGIS